MNRPSNNENFLIEVTQEQLDTLRQVYKYVDDDGYVELHYSPHWKKPELANTQQPNPSKEVV